MDREAPYIESKRRLGLRIALLRSARSLSQRQLSAEIGLDRATLNRIESGVANPTLDTLCRIADGLGCDGVEDLFER